VSDKRIVITGIGVVSPIGIGKEKFSSNLFDGQAGFRPITLFDTKDLKVKIGGEITDFNPKEILGSRGLMDLDRATLLLNCAAKLALDDAKLNITNENSDKIGVSVGTTFGSLHSISKFDREAIKEGPRYANPSVFPSTVGNSPASRLNIRFNIKGFSSTISTGMCAALDATNYACDFMKLNRINTVVVGAVEDFSIQTFLGFYKLNYLSGLKGGAEPLSCPFDRRRDGIIFSEGSVVFIIEELASAKERNADIYAEILGIGSSFDPVKFYRFNPRGTGMAEAMKLSLKDSRLEPQDIDCIFANANSTKDADKIETKAIKDVFGAHVKQIPITALKSVIGETFSASGAFSIIAAIFSLNKNSIPAIKNYEKPDPDCDLDYVSGSNRKKQLRNIMVNAFGPNGENTTTIISKFKEN